MNIYLATKFWSLSLHAYILIQFGLPSKWAAEVFEMTYQTSNLTYSFLLLC